MDKRTPHHERLQPVNTAALLTQGGADSIKNAFSERIGGRETDEAEESRLERRLRRLTGLGFSAP